MRGDQAAHWQAALVTMVSLTQSWSLRVSKARAEHLRADSMLALWPVLKPLALQIDSAAGPQRSFL